MGTQQILLILEMGSFGNSIGHISVEKPCLHTPGYELILREGGNECQDRNRLWLICDKHDVAMGQINRPNADHRFSVKGWYRGLFIPEGSSWTTDRLKAETPNKAEMMTWRGDTPPPKNVNFNEAETHTYTLLGVCYARIGWLHDVLWKEANIPAPTHEKRFDYAWRIAQRPGVKEQLERLWDFRKRIAHGICLVHPDGTLKTFYHGEPKDYSQQELQKLANEIVSFDINVAIQSTFSTFGQHPDGTLHHANVEGWTYTVENGWVADSPDPLYINAE